MSLFQLKNVDAGIILWQGTAPSLVAAIEQAVAAGTDLTGMDLCGQDLTGLNVGCALFDKTEFKGAILTGANLAGSKMRGCTLRGAYCEGVNFGGNLMAGADLDGIIVDSKTNFRGTDWTTPFGAEEPTAKKRR